MTWSGPFSWQHGSSRRMQGRLALSSNPKAKAILSFWPHRIDGVRSLAAVGILVAWGNPLMEEAPEGGKMFYPIFAGIISVAIISLESKSNTRLVRIHKPGFPPVSIFFWNP